LPGVDIVCDLETVRAHPIGLTDGTVEHFLLSQAVEHIRDSLGLMRELWRLAKPGADAELRVPHGASDDAWGNPTHVRAYFLGSFGYFSQPHYWRADYGYRGDWQPERNVVREVICELRRDAGAGAEARVAGGSADRDCPGRLIASSRYGRPRTAAVIVDELWLAICRKLACVRCLVSAIWAIEDAHFGGSNDRRTSATGRPRPFARVSRGDTATWTGRASAGRENSSPVY
jgi:hypothetical protein